MIVGHGIDIESIQSIEQAYQRHPRFASKVLTETERERFDQLSGKRKLEYLAGRWSAKEAFSKAWELPIFQKLLLVERFGYRLVTQAI